MQCQDNTNTIYAGFGVRMMAFIIDSLLIWVTLLFARLPVFVASIINPNNFLNTPILFKFNLSNIIFYLLGAAYFIFMTYYSGSTLGKKLLRLKVTSYDGCKLTFIDVLYRETIGRYLSAIAFIGYLMIAIDNEKRSLHDRLCDTRVIYNFKLPIKPPPEGTIKDEQVI
ncbi:MAG: RDD family protein [Clostridium sp.]|nr:RDD family protein [Clostridium sp.]